MSKLIEQTAISPKAWGARVDYDSWNRQDTETSLKYWFLHYPGTPNDIKSGLENSKRLLRSYENYHLSKKWRGIAYDYAIDLEGNFFRLRGHGYSAATSGDMSENGVPNNFESDAILLLVGNNQKLSKAMLNTLVQVLRSRPLLVYGHREGKGTVTACPGNHVMAFIQEWRNGRVPDKVPNPEEGNVRPPEASPTPAPNNPKVSVSWTERLVRNLPTLRQRSDLSRASIHDRRLQGLLAAHGFLPLAANTVNDRFDGKFGPSTNSSVRRFQSSKRITVDGIVGQQTWTKLLGG